MRTQRPYAKYFRAAAVLVCGLGLGLIATVLSLGWGYGFNAMRAGPWTAWPQIGGMSIDPYARAVIARTGEAPLGLDQGVAFVAHDDSSGAPLDGGCEYLVKDPSPSARFWTLGLASPEGALIANPTGRYSFTSADILRNEGGGFRVAISREARPGNWLSPGKAREFVLVLRLYDTSLDSDSHPDAAAFPKIEKLDCA